MTRLRCVALSLAIASTLLGASGCRYQVRSAPTDVYSILGAVPVLYVDTIRTTDSTDFAVGAFDYWGRRVLIRREALRHPLTAYAIAEHEACHITLIDAGVKVRDPQLLEIICDAIAQVRVAERIARRKR